jgi:histidyl-tRNA synthetase
MGKIVPQTLKGFRDFLPQEAKKRQWLKGEMIKVFERWGYEPLETPTLEPLEIFAGEIGEDEKLFFQFKDLGGRDVVMRYDQTVPTCRVIAQYKDQLVFPFRRYQIQSAFRAEKPQKGRYREFIQADIDIFGIKGPEADAECIAVSIDLYRSLGFKDAYVIVNTRELLKGIPYPAVVAIDKLKKIGEENVLKEMQNKGIPLEDSQAYMKKIKELEPDETIKAIFSYLKSSGFPENSYKFERTLARSFSYSQGPIWEVIIPGYETGSVGGGERYDGIFQRMIGSELSGTGIAFGFDRTLEAAELYQLIPDVSFNSKVLVTIFSKETMEYSLKVATFLRDKRINTEIYPDPQSKLDKQLKYADKKGIPYVVIIGPDEVEKGTVQLKNLQTKEQKEIKSEELINFLK